MATSRERWLATLDRYRRSPTAPDDDSYWSRSLDTASRDELRGIQDEKLAAAVHFAYDAIPFYRRSFDDLGLAPTDIRGTDDLHLLPAVTKQAMADDAAASPPWGTYTAVDDHAGLE